MSVGFYWLNNRREAGRGLVVLCCIAVMAGCRAAPGYLAQIQSDDAGTRILAMREAAEAMDRKAVPLLVDRLEDEDEAVRLFAILALDKITGRRMGYNYAQPSWQRSMSVEHWRDTLNNEQPPEMVETLKSPQNTP